MHVNFAMWRTAIWSLVKMDKKEEWDRLDVVSKWLIATRSGVTLVTVYTCVIAGLLAWRDHYFAFIPWLILTVGLFIAHGTNNLLNDYTDFSRGVDKDNYFRTQYGVHPLVQNFWTKPTQIRWFMVSGVIAFLSGVYALFYSHFSPIVIAFFALGALVLLFYTYPLKYFGIGELAIFLIWGPVMVAGVYLVLALHNPNANLGNMWNVVLAGVPFGLSVASINVGKHIDKMREDKAKGVGTLPVRIGETAARYINIAVLLLIYLVTLYLVFIPRYFTPLMLIILLAVPRLITAVKILSKPRPETAPPGYPIWPTYFSAFNFNHNRMLGGLFILALIGDTLLRIFVPAFWPMR